MATKKKAPKKSKKAAPKRAAKKSPARARRAAPPLPAPLAAAPASAPKGRNGLLLAAMILLAAGTVLWRSRKEDQLPAPPTAAEQAPARSVSAAQAPKDASKAKAAAVRRADAGETGAPSLTYDRAEGGTLSVRCWRADGAAAALDVFGPRNQRVRRIESATGKAGWVTLDWDGKDADGKAVPTGLYWLRPSTDGRQQLRDVWVKG